MYMAFTKPETNVCVAASSVPHSMVICSAHYSYNAVTLLVKNLANAPC